MNGQPRPSYESPSPLHRVRTWLAIWLPFVVLATIFFGGSFVRQEQFVFRDAAHFYYPLFHEVTRQWKAGEIPLWSPWDGIGVPLAADATPSVFYPGKLLLVTPLGFDFGLRLYVLIHYAIAYAGIYVAARIWGCSRTASVLAAVAYAFGGPLLSYHSNIIFLVGSSWLPWAMVCGWRLARRPALLPGMGLGSCLAMMILGGDPQLAFHTMMLLSLAAVVFVLPWKTEATWSVWLRWRTFRMGALGTAAFMAFSLSAIQILPSSEWAARSVRATSHEPRSVYELAATAIQGKEIAWDTLLGDPPDGSHARHSYDFSIAPWVLPEMFVANFRGKLYPRNERWTRAIPADGRIWFQSVFLGSLVCLFAAAAFFRGSARRVDRWLIGVAAFGLLASLGWYGLGWIILEVGHLVGWNGTGMPVGSPFGGLYWLMNLLVPKFSGFRYPAKWWIFVAFAVPILAGRGLDHFHVSCRGFRWSMIATVVGVLIGGCFLVASPWFAASLPDVPNDALFGPLDAAAGLSQMAIGMLQATAAIALGISAFYFLPRQVAVCLIVVLVGAELGISNRWILVTAPQALWHQGGFEKTNVPLNDRRSYFSSYYDRNENIYPESFANTGSDDRMIEGMKIDRRESFPRYQMLEPMRNSPAVVSIRPRDYETLWNSATSHEQRELVRKMFGCYPVGLGTFREAWWLNQVQWHDPIEDASSAAMWQGTREILDTIQAANMPQVGPVIPPDIPSSQHMAWDKDFGYPAVLEAEQADRLDAPPVPASSLVITNYRRERAGQIIIELVDCQPGWMVFREYFDRGWQCEIVGRNGQARTAVPIYRANRVMMAVPVEAGDTLVTLTYLPRSFVIGAIISAISWAVLLITLVVIPLKRSWPSARQR
ncbi:hypothetical protein DTL21_14405 [Bremerella cremea]|uniref:Membrane protein 6-pyruvoyl-tetrahydropterin synthase-related domain-containing protein n=1 Tax=Blastopirellula marina TaxID=124 RepID=A0A2S8FR90_9BACT|nr:MULTISPECIES: hypothetical protein [Pirellulaceae]PQO34692.1 hypothetical protein C5Y83_14400 [Blastopirellula marina]RCS47190.1 hypothetical protein DTL21_14405 [Bremerella cremea]